MRVAKRMYTNSSLLLLAGWALLFPQPAKAQQIILDYFNFNSANLTKTSGVDTGTLATNFSPGSTGYDFTSTGTSLNAQPGSIAGTPVNFRNGTNGGNNGKTLTLSASTTNPNAFKDIIFSYATAYSSTAAFTTQTLDYSLDGSAFTNFGTVTQPSSLTANAYSVQSFNLSALTSDAVNGQSSLLIRITFTGGSAASGNSGSANRIDNLTLSGTPAPPALISLLLGSCATGLTAWQRRRKALAGNANDTDAQEATDAAA